MTTWHLPEPSAEETRQAVLAHLRQAAEDHWRVGLACADLGLVDAWAEHQMALSVVLRALVAETREHAGWSIAAEP